jgi:hypothetical protein
MRGRPRGPTFQARPHEIPCAPSKPPDCVGYCLHDPPATGECDTPLPHRRIS